MARDPELQRSAGPRRPRHVGGQSRIVPQSRAVGIPWQHPNLVLHFVCELRESIPSRRGAPRGRPLPPQLGARQSPHRKWVRASGPATTTSPSSPRRRWRLRERPSLPLRPRRKAQGEVDPPREMRKSANYWHSVQRHRHITRRRPGPKPLPAGPLPLAKLAKLAILTAMPPETRRPSRRAKARHLRQGSCTAPP